MTIRKKTLLAVSSTLIILILLLFTISSYILMNGFLQLEKQDTQKNISRVKDALDSRINQIDKTDWAQWDDAYTFIQDANQGFVDSNIASSFASLHLNLMIFIRNSGEIILSKYFDMKNNKDLPLPEKMKTFFVDNSKLRTHAKEDSVYRGIWLFEEGPMLLVARPVLSSKQQGPIHGTMITGRYLDADEIKKTGGSDPFIGTSLQYGKFCIAGGYPIRNKTASNKSGFSFSSIKGYRYRILTSE